MKRFFLLIVVLPILSLPVVSQHHYSNWVHRSTTDTTIVRCWNDSLTMMKFPSGSMMGMMLPDSIYCRIDRMPMDSLHHPHDSTFLGWHRMQIGTDSMHFNYMHCDGWNGSNAMMQFMKNIRCEIYWDSLKTDSLHRPWHPTGVMGWNGSKWTALPNVTIIGNKAVVTTSSSYSALAIVGKPNQITGSNGTTSVASDYALSQNYPNPFNPSTRLDFQLPRSGYVSLRIYDMLGREMATLVNEVKNAGIHSVQWNAAAHASGMYYARLSTENFSAVRKLLLAK